jgi:hypothetical protein
MPARLSRRACLAVALIACLNVSANSACAQHSAIAAQEVSASSTIRLPLIGGSDDLNRHERDAHGNYARERRYDRDSVPAGFVVAEWRILDDALTMSPATGPVDLIVRGHLEELDVPSAHPDSVVLTVESQSEVGLSRHSIRARDLARLTVTETHGRYQIATVRLDGTVRQVRVVFAGSASVAIESVSVQSRNEGGSGR